ncbi:type VI secretion system baseplate subunit TssG [Rubellimicrobium arenae]|uniref:type VI secretion system baseplate subunit TssG n=1 Tax=Rubellimicrobium arenae TaxID=2817372 RepID=UPI001B30EAFB|nr:type VI secretion system baseplate subunit TssG [Rubellimicrobium arenae]
MADDARRPGDDLIAPDRAASMGFFELLRRLEASGGRFGRGGPPDREPARLGQSARLAIATGDVAQVRVGDGPPRVDVEVIGLLGPEGPMPLHLTRWILERLSQRWFETGRDQATADRTALEFCNMLQHRMIGLYWRAWGDAQPAVHLGRGPGAGRIGATLAALAGVGLPGLRPPGGPMADTEAVKLDHATRIAHQLPGGERLTVPLADLLDAPVRLKEFVAAWIDIPVPLQTRIARDHARLGRGAVVGERVFSRQDRIELRVGPVGLKAFVRLADDRSLRRRLRHLVLHLVGREVDVDLRPVLHRDEVPEPRLGQVALGRTAWLPTRRAADRDDLSLRRITRDAA